jgi:FKBP-type peptidyl-prolyl cis-trans isomerase (trigger factor)
VTDEEVAQEIDRMAQSEPRQAARVRAHYQSPERRASLKESLLERKALDWIINVADVHDEVITETPLIVPAVRSRADGPW